MIQDMNYLSMLFINLLLVGVWHGTTFLLSTRMPDSDFQPSEGLFHPWKWEKGGRWYRDHLHINDWKDRVPQFVSADGFSKKHITDMSVEYLNQFISETCRGEWMHTWNLGSIALTLLVNQSMVGVTFSVLIFMGNFPCTLIQRYNRFRLEILRKKLQRDAVRMVAAV